MVSNRLSPPPPVAVAVPPRAGVEVNDDDEEDGLVGVRNGSTAAAAGV